MFFSELYVPGRSHIALEAIMHANLWRRYEPKYDVEKGL